jgi:hypothetical protein
MESATQKKRLLAGRIVSALAVLFLLFDSVGHLIVPAAVADAFNRLGYPLKLGPVIGILELICIVIYVVPRTFVLGAILLTGYLGGAVSANLRVDDPLFETLFPVIIGALIWAGIWLRDERLRTLVPLRGKV